MLSNLFLNGFVYVGVDHSRIATVVDLSLQLVVVARENIEAIGQLLNLRVQTRFLLFQPDHVLVVSVTLIVCRRLHLSRQIVVGYGLEELFEFGLCDISYTLSSNAFKVLSS